MPDDEPGRRIFLATPGFEGALLDELPAAGQPHAVVAWPGLVVADEPPPETPPHDPVFARQQLPGAREVGGGSVAALAERCYALAESAIDHAQGPFTVHAFALTGADPRLGGRAALIAEQTLSLLRQRRKRASRAHRAAADALPRFDELALVLQILLVERARGFLSIAPPRRLATGGWDIAPWPAGVAPVADDRHPPSRAYRKLEEAFQWMGTEPAPGALCVDLGGAPGGWSYTALKRGARVIAVDRSPLAPPVVNHPQLTMIEGNAFTYQPPGAVDWLLSDVVCEPARVLELLARWVDRAACRNFVVTVKFKGRSGYGFLSTVRDTLTAAETRRFRIKHLVHNKNEVTVMGSTAAETDARP